jgi:oligoendopeptidase F
MPTLFRLNRGLSSLLAAAVLLSACVAFAGPGTDQRDEIPDQYKWDVSDIFPDFESWEEGYAGLDAMIDEFAALKGTLSDGPAALLRAYQMQDEMGQLAYGVWYYVNLQRDEDLRDTEMDAYRQRVQVLFAKWGEATSWFSPEHLEIPLDTVRDWMASNLDLSLYRFAIENLYRQQEHVLDEGGETLLAYQSRYNSAPQDIYSMLSTADVDFPTITLSNGEEVTVTSGQYYALLESERVRADREAVWRAYFELYEQNNNTYTSIYNALCQRDWAQAQSRGYDSTLEAALDGNNIPTAVVENLIATAKEGAGPLQRYYAVRAKLLGEEKVAVYDGYVSLVPNDNVYEYDDAKQMVLASVGILGDEYQQQMAQGFDSRWIDVYENAGKRSGAYSAGVYGVHPYMLLNYTDGLGDVFTLAHEFGHSMHTVLANENQPFVYSDYTIFVAEVASTLNEGLLLDYWLAQTQDPYERINLLQHAIDQIALTFYRQTIFADWELQAHRLVENGQPITSDTLNQLYLDLLREYYGPDTDIPELYGVTWSRIPHFFRSPYYVYQYATCFASSAALLKDIRSEDPQVSADGVRRYLELLSAGGSDYPMEELKNAGVDLSERAPFQAVIDQMDGLVTLLEAEVANLEGS